LKLTNITSSVLGAEAITPGTGVRFDAGTPIFMQRGGNVKEASVLELREGQTLKVWTDGRRHEIRAPAIPREAVHHYFGVRRRVEPAH
jgi:hypothetical protein